MKILLEDPEDIRALMRVLSDVLNLVAEGKFNERSMQNKIVKIDKILRDALSANRINPLDIATIAVYLDTVGGTSGTLEWIMMRVHQNMSTMKLVDIGLALSLVKKLTDPA